LTGAPGKDGYNGAPGAPGSMTVDNVVNRIFLMILTFWLSRTSRRTRQNW
jgi:hypothetical protein